MISLNNKSKIVLIIIFVIALLICAMLLIVRNSEQTTIGPKKIETKIIYGYCPNDSYIDIDTVFIKNTDELEEKLISQLEKAKKQLEQSKQDDPQGYENVEIEDNIIFVDKNWKVINDEWEKLDYEFKNNKTVEEYFNDDFFEKNNILVFSYSLYNDTYLVDTVQVYNDTAYIKLKFDSVNGGPFDDSVGYCFVILDKNINKYEIIR